MKIKIIIMLIFFNISAFATTHKIAVIVGNHVITDYDLDQKIRFMMFTQGIDPVQNKPSTLYGYFLNPIIDNDLLTSRIKETGGSVSPQDIELGMQYMAQTRKTTVENLINKAIIEYGMTKESFASCIKDDMIMQVMFLSPLGNDVKISDDEVNEEAKKESIKLDDKEGIQRIKNMLMQKAIGQKAKQIIQGLRQSTFIEIKR
jgi:hypothetical protein